MSESQSGTKTRLETVKLNFLNNASMVGGFARLRDIWVLQGVDTQDTDTALDGLLYEGIHCPEAGIQKDQSNVPCWM